jgi:multiple sugar transport system substrate-binding protein
VKGVSIPADLATLTAFIRSAGSEVVDDPLNPTSLTLASDEALATIDAVASLARDPIVSLTKADLTTKPPVDWFIDGELGMFIGSRDDLPRLRAADGLRFDVYPLPSFGKSRSVARMNAYCIDSETKHVDAAADFVTFAVGDQGSEIAASSEEIVPTNLDMVHTETFTQPGEQPRHSQEYLAGIRRSDPLPFSSAWLEVSAEADQVLQQLYTRLDIDLEGTLEERMTKLDTSSEELFGKAAPATE